jgi:hypothetical protein
MGSNYGKLVPGFHSVRAILPVEFELATKLANQDTGILFVKFQMKADRRILHETKT